MKKDLLTMSKIELTRLEIIQRLEEKQHKQKVAGEMRGISTRQIRHLQKNNKIEGAAGIISKRRGRTSNNQLDPQT